MKILGLITEYNPFHNGHLHHLKESKALTGADLTIAVMSGHFLQRGALALTDKWTRAEMAVRCGIDLVVELPAIYACSSAEFFSSAGVSLLHAMGATELCFGSEDGAIAPLITTARILAEEPPAFKDALRVHLDRGLSFPDARKKALSAVLSSADAGMDQPNAILGIEYCKAILMQGIPMTPHTIQRVNAGYHSTDITGEICSATAIRQLIRNAAAVPSFHSVMPSEAATLMDAACRSGNIASENELFPILRYLLRMLPSDQEPDIADCEHGLLNRMIEASQTADTFDELVQKTKTRRYTLTRIQRVLMALLLGIRKDTRERLGAPRYIRVLGTSGTGRSYLKSHKKMIQLPVINNLARFKSDDDRLKEMLAYDILSTDLFSMTLENHELRTQGKDYKVRCPFLGN